MSADYKVRPEVQAAADRASVTKARKSMSLAPMGQVHGHLCTRGAACGADIGSPENQDAHNNEAHLLTNGQTPDEAYRDEKAGAGEY